MGRMGWLAAGAAVVGLMGGDALAADKHKIFLSMSYIGNDWQAEAANMVKAMAAHKRLAGQGRPAGPGRRPERAAADPADQRHGAGRARQAIVVFPISPTALNQVVKNACDKGVLVFAYDAEITEPCAYNVSIDQEEAGRVTAEWLVEQAGRQGQHRGDHRRARHLGRHAAHRGGEGGLRQASRHQDRRRGGRHVEPGGRPHRALEDPRHPQLGRHRRAVDAGRLLHGQLDAARGRQDSRSSCCPAPAKARTAAASRCCRPAPRSRAPSSPYAPMGAPRISYASPPYSGGLALKLAVAEARGQGGRRRLTILPLPHRHQRHDQALRRKAPGRR